MNDYIRKIENGNLNDVYVLAINNNKFIIRSSKNANNFEVEVLRKLNKYDLQVPILLSDLIYNERYITVLKYIEGEEPKELNYNQLENLANLIKKIHHIPINDLENNKNQPVESLNVLMQYFEKIKNSFYLKKNFEYILKYINDFSKIEFDKLEKHIIHGDIKKPNMLVNKDKVYLIDFGNCYLGNRMIELIRVIMWLFLKDYDLDFNKISFFLHSYFKDNDINEIELKNLHLLIRYCLIYNIVKDIYLYENGELNEKYIKDNDLKWIEILKDEVLLNKVEEAIKNVSRYS